MHLNELTELTPWSKILSPTHFIRGLGGGQRKERFVTTSIGYGKPGGLPSPVGRGIDL